MAQKIDLGKLSEQETCDLVKEAVPLLKEEHQLEVVDLIAGEVGKDELISYLEKDC